MNQKNTLDYIKKCEYKKREPGKTWHEQYCFFYKCYCKDALSNCERMKKYFKYARTEKEPRAAAENPGRK